MALIFPKWTNEIPKVAPPVLGLLTAFGVFVVWFWFSPWHTDVGYQPHQPIAYSHKLHAGDLGMDCRYCHNIVEESKHAGVPPTATCMNCHAYVRTDSPLLAPLRKSWTDGTPIPWVRIHKAPDYAYFDHSAHVNAGVGCVSCHGRVDRMEVVAQREALTMSWCLDCHRNPEPHLRPLDQVTSMDWAPLEDPTIAGRRLREIHGIDPSTDCTTCHR
jgi:menaquinone reductase, multiheme cytochrome c subunit